MQSNKAPKKTRKAAEQAVTAAADVTAAANVSAKPRTSRSSKVKSDAPEAGAVKHHHKAVAPLQVEKAATVSAPSEQATELVIQGVSLSDAPSRLVARDQIAALAYSFWAARGYAHGSAEEDWLRAERELLSAR